MKQKWLLVLLVLACIAAVAYWRLGGGNSREVDVEGNVETHEVRQMINEIVVEEQNDAGGPSGLPAPPAPGGP